MGAQILGAYFKAIVGSMRTTASLFPEHRQRINEMKDQEWYPWNDYLKITNDVHGRLGDAPLMAIGQASVLKTLPLSKEAGFDTPEKVFKDFEALWKNMVKDLPTEDSIRTASFSSNSVVLETETRLPSALLLGSFKGLLMGFGKVVTESEVTKDGATTRFTLKWV